MKCKCVVILRPFSPRKNHHTWMQSSSSKLLPTSYLCISFSAHQKLKSLLPPTQRIQPTLIFCYVFYFFFYDFQQNSSIVASSFEVATNWMTFKWWKECNTTIVAILWSVGRSHFERHTKARKTEESKSTNKGTHTEREKETTQKPQTFHIVLIKRICLL